MNKTVGTGRSRSECQHIIQSFAPGEVTPERDLLIGQELCKALFNDEYLYVLAVHVDHSHVHNHVIVKKRTGLPSRYRKSGRSKRRSTATYRTNKLPRERRISLNKERKIL